MDILNSESLGNLLEVCSDNSGYYGLIVFNTEAELKEFVREFVNLNKQSRIPGVRIIKQRYNSGIIEFMNDSNIRLVTASTGARGIRSNTILFSNTIPIESRDIFNRFITPYKTTQWENENKWASEFMSKWVTDDEYFKVDPMENVTDTGELDNFLNGFRIASGK